MRKAAALLCSTCFELRKATGGPQPRALHLASAQRGKGEGWCAAISRRRDRPRRRRIVEIFPLSPPRTCPHVLMGTNQAAPGAGWLPHGAGVPWHPAGGGKRARSAVPRKALRDTCQNGVLSLPDRQVLAFKGELKCIKKNRRHEVKLVSGLKRNSVL